MVREDKLWTTRDGELFLKERMSSTVRDQLNELEGLRADMRKAREYMNKCKQRYLKDKLKKKTLAAVQEEDPFKELEEYPTLSSIEDAYGYDCITEEEFDHLRELWEMRERFQEESKGKPEYEDNVTRMLDWTMNHLGGAVKDRLEELEEVEADFNQNVTYIVAKHNLQVRSW